MQKAVKGLKTDLENIFTTYTKDKLEISKILNELKQRQTAQQKNRQKMQ